jgi:hypothetical protein
MLSLCKPARVSAQANDKAELVEKIGYIGARLRERSTYAGLTVLVAFLLPFMAKYVPTFSHASAAVIVDYISMIGIGVGGLIAIFVPEGRKAVILLAIGVGLTLNFGGSAEAATAQRKAPQISLFPIPLPMPAPNKAAAAPAPAPSLGDALETFINKISNVDEIVLTNVIAAIKVADEDAGTVVTPTTETSPAVVKDPISHACYPAQIQWLQSLPTAKTTNVPVPYNLIVLFQYKRDFVNLLRSGQLIPTYLKLGCGAMIGDEASIFAQTLGLIGIGAASINPITAFGSRARCRGDHDAAGARDTVTGQGADEIAFCYLLGSRVGRHPRARGRDGADDRLHTLARRDACRNQRQARLPRRAL